MEDEFFFFKLQFFPLKTFFDKIVYFMLATLLIL